MVIAINSGVLILSLYLCDETDSSRIIAHVDEHIFNISLNI
jgi:hypothetical protein